MRLRDVLIGGAAGAAPRTDAGLLLLRAFAGAALAFGHGIGKLPPTERFVGMVATLGFQPAELFALLSGLAEFGGGLLLVAGLLTRPAAFFILINMLVAAFMQGAGDPFRENELALLFAAVAGALLLAGAGRFSLDGLLHRRYVRR